MMTFLKIPFCFVCQYIKSTRYVLRTYILVYALLDILKYQVKYLKMFVSVYILNELNT